MPFLLFHMSLYIAHHTTLQIHAQLLCRSKGTPSDTLPNNSLSCVEKCTFTFGIYATTRQTF